MLFQPSRLLMNMNPKHFCLSFFFWMFWTSQDNVHGRVQCTLLTLVGPERCMSSRTSLSWHTTMKTILFTGQAWLADQLNKPMRFFEFNFIVSHSIHPLVYLRRLRIIGVPYRIIGWNYQYRTMILFLFYFLDLLIQRL